MTFITSLEGWITYPQKSPEFITSAVYHSIEPEQGEAGGIREELGEKSEKGSTKNTKRILTTWMWIEYFGVLSV